MYRSCKMGLLEIQTLKVACCRLINWKVTILQLNTLNKSEHLRSSWPKYFLSQNFSLCKGGGKAMAGNPALLPVAGCYLQEFGMSAQWPALMLGAHSWLNCWGKSLVDTVPFVKGIINMQISDFFMHYLHSWGKVKKNLTTYFVPTHVGFMFLQLKPVVLALKYFQKEFFFGAGSVELSLSFHFFKVGLFLPQIPNFCWW